VLAQMMRIAQGMQHPPQSVVGLPVVMDDDADHPFPQTADQQKPRSSARGNDAARSR